MKEASGDILGILSEFIILGQVQLTGPLTDLACRDREEQLPTAIIKKTCNIGKEE